MDAHRQREIARKGGRAAHEKGKAHEFTPDEARAAGRKGGEKVSMNRKHMAEIGRRGGRSSAQRRRPSGNGNAGGNGSPGQQAAPDFASEANAGGGNMSGGQMENAGEQAGSMGDEDESSST